MNRLSITVAFFALLFLTGQNALAQSGYDLFQKGLVKERTEGDLEEAIRLYKQIVADHKDDRALAAKALVQMGQCYEKLGRAEARKAYERVVQEFADQPEPARIARQHLEKLNGGVQGAKGNGPTYRLFLDEKIAGMPVGELAFSPGGDRIVFVSKKKLYFADRSGTVTRPILEDMGSWYFLTRLCWSPNSRLIAYRASKKVTSGPNTDEMHAIFVLNVDGGMPRKIVPEQKQRIVAICWTPDGKGLTYASVDGIHTLMVDGSEVHFIPREDLPKHPWPWGMAYSPNGLWLTFSARKENSPYRRKTDVCILSASGGTVRRLTNLPGHNADIDWSPDGRTLYFRSETRKTHNIWKLAMDPETGSAKGEPEQVTFFTDTRIPFFQVIGDGNRIILRMTRPTTCIQVADASSPRESRVLASGFSPQLSPDGQTIYFVNEMPGEEGIYAVSRQIGTSWRLTQILPVEGHMHLPRFDLSPDGQMLAYCVKIGNKQDLLTLLVSDGEPRLLVKITNAESDIVPQWSPDGSNLAYAAGKGLYVIPKEGGESRKLAHLERGWEEWTVRWSPDGKFLAALCCDMDDTPNPGPQNAVFVVPASGGELRQLTPDVKYKEGLEWHPDGTRLTYQIYANPSQTHQVYLDGRSPSLLVDAPDIWDYVGVWAPDGRRFFFEGDHGIYAYDEASGETTLAMEGSNAPCWSRDGKTMAWTATRSTAPQLWLMENFLPKSKSSE